MLAFCLQRRTSNSNICHCRCLTLFFRIEILPDPTSPRLVAELLVVLTQAQGIAEVTGLLVGVLSVRR